MSGDTNMSLSLSCKLNPFGHSANVGKDVGKLSYLDEM